MRGIGWTTAFAALGLTLFPYCGAASEPAKVVWQLDLVGGGRIVGRPVMASVEVQTEFGKLTVPVGEVRKLTPGLESRPEWKRRVEGLVKQLGDPAFAVREAASRELVAMRVQAHAVLEAARDDVDAERRVRARRLLETKPAAKPGETAEDPWPRYDVVVAGAQTIAGKVGPDPAAIDTAYGRVSVPWAAITTLSPPPSSRPVDLLKEIDVERDAVAGKWTWEGATLVSPQHSRVRLQIPYAPPEEYTLAVTATPKAGRKLGDKPIADSLFIGLVVGGRTCNVALNAFSDVKGGPYAGLDTLKRRRTHLEPLFKGAVFKLDEELTAEVTVRRGSVAVSTGGKPLFTWRGDASELDTSESWRLREPRRLGIGAHFTTYHISRFELTPIIEPRVPREIPAGHSAVRTKDGSLWIGRVPAGHASGQSFTVATSHGTIAIPAGEGNVLAPVPGQRDDDKRE